MLGLQTESKAAKWLYHTADAEKQVEIVRQVLSEQPTFEPYSAFKRLDRISSGFLTIGSILSFLRENELKVSEKDIQNLFSVYDSNQDGKLSYSDFLNIVLPQTSPALRQLCTQRKSYFVSMNETLPYETEWALAKVFDKEMNYLRKLELLKNDFLVRYDYNFADFFSLLDFEGKGILNADSFFMFLHKNKLKASEIDINNLMRRIDRDRDGVVTFAEMLQYTNPLDKIIVRASSKAASPQKNASRHQTPTRSSVKDIQKATFHSSYNKLMNYDYYEYLSNSANAKVKTEASPIKVTAFSPSRKDQALDVKELSSPHAFETPSKKSSLLDSIYQSANLSGSKNKKSANVNDADDHQYLALSLKEQIDLDKELENQKNELALRSDFNLMDAFRYFDVDGRGYITKTELNAGFQSFDIYPTTNELYLLMRRFDKDSDGLIKYAEFCEMLNPKEIDYSSILAGRSPSYVQQEEINLVFSSQTKHLLRKCLNLVLNNEVYSEEIRIKLEKKNSFDIYEAYKTLDTNKLGYITLKDFRNILADQGLFASTKDLYYLVKRYDRNDDGKISYADFVQELTPKSAQKKLL